MARLLLLSALAAAKGAGLDGAPPAAARCAVDLGISLAPSACGPQPPAARRPAG